jgi:dTDP-4-dehydrorhamnose 3,5-epimerase
MKYRQLAIEGAWEITPVQHGDPRGLFMEWYRFEAFTDATGHPLRLAQANLSVSQRGVVRGVHFAGVPVGQAKYVTCVRGSFVDVVIDLRVGSPTFGKWDTVRLDEVDRRAIYLSEGLGHAVCALEDDSALLYLCSEVYNPAAEHTVNPLDPQIAIEWPVDDPQLSARDLAAPSLAEALEAGLLPDFQVCQDYIARLNS